MQKCLTLTLALLLTSSFAPAQTPAVDIPLTISDGAGGMQALRLGLDPTATNGIDAHLGEFELPPFPPSGVFEARFIGDDINIPELGQGAYKDYRPGDKNFRGTQTHEIKYQVGTGTSIVISWNLSNGANGILQDIITGNLINQIMSGIGNFTVTNPSAFNKLKLIIDYSTTDVKEPSSLLPQTYSLAQNYPNPFNPSTMIKYGLLADAKVRLEVYDVLGHRVAVLIDAPEKAGFHEIVFENASLPSGVYFYRLQAGTFTHTMKMMLMR